MSRGRQAVVGIFTIVALAALFGIFVVISNIGTSGRYPVGVRFKSAAGLHKGALVYLSGVNVGTVQATNLLPDDFSVEVILSINNGVDIPRSAKFLIQAPLTGDSTVEIVPPPTPPQAPGAVAPTPAPAAIAVLPHEVLPLDQQPQGQNPTTIQDLLAQGQGEVKRLDDMLVLLERREPRLLATLQSALDNANGITVTTKATVAELSSRIDTLTTQLQTALGRGSGNLIDVTAQLDQTVRANRGHFDSIAASLDRSAVSLNETADSVRDIAADPRVHRNLLQATQGIADTATTVSTLAHDLRSVTGNEQTQAQLRDTIANADAAVQKANSLLGSFGGRSSVYGVDAGATPAPAVSGAPRSPSRVPGAAPSPAPGTVQQNVKSKLNAIVRNLVTVQVRVGELSTYKAGSNASPLLGNDRGPQTDFNLYALPQGSTSLYAGANDIGSTHTSYNFLPSARFGNVNVGLGVLYSRLGMRAVYVPPPGRRLGAEGRLYDLRHPTADGYLNFGLGNNVTLFGGERDVLHDGRRTTLGLQYQF